MHITTMHHAFLSALTPDVQTRPLGKVVITKLQAHSRRMERERIERALAKAHAEQHASAAIQQPAETLAALEH